jgi:hypothetical protein
MAMDFIQVVLVIGVFFLGVVFLVLGFTRNDAAPPPGNLILPEFPVQVEPFDGSGSGIPPEPDHRVRLRLVGVGLIVLGVVLGLILV